MKKLIYSLFAAALAFSSCATWDDPTVENYGEGARVDLSIDAVGDSAITFSLKADGRAAYCSYALYEGAVADVNATTLLKASGNGLVNVCYAASEHPDTVITVGGLMPNTRYSVYAIASTQEGIVGEVASSDTITTDNLIPGLSGAGRVENGVSVTFEEAVKRGQGAVTCTAYKEWDLLNTQEVEVAVSIQGNSVQLVAVDPAPGAYLAFNWEEGAFEDATGNKCAAYNRSGLDMTTGGFVGLYTQAEAENFALAEDALLTEPGNITDLQSFAIIYDLGETRYVNTNALAGNEIAVTYTNDLCSTTTKVAYGSSWFMVNMGEEGLTVGDGEGTHLYIALPTLPAAGDRISVSVAEGTLYNVWGCANEAFGVEEGWLVSKGYTRDMVLGDYSWSYVSYWSEDGSAESMDIAIEADPESEDGVIIKDMLVEGSQLTATFDGVAGTVTIPDWQVLFESEQNGRVYVFSTYDTEAVTLDVNADGSMVGKASQSANGIPWGIYVLDSEGNQLGWYDLAASDITVSHREAAAEARPLRAALRRDAQLAKKR